MPHSALITCMLFPQTVQGTILWSQTHCIPFCCQDIGFVRDVLSHLFKHKCHCLAMLCCHLKASWKKLNFISQHQPHGRGYVAFPWKGNFKHGVFHQRSFHAPKLSAAQCTHCAKKKTFQVVVEHDVTVLWKECS